MTTPERPNTIRKPARVRAGAGPGQRRRSAMDETEAAELLPAEKADKKYLTVRQAAFIGVGAMVGAGIFALLGAAGEVAGAAVWLSFLIAGFVAVLLTFVFTTLSHEPASIATLLGVLALSIGLDYGWKHNRPSRSVPVQVSP